MALKTAFETQLTQAFESADISRFETLGLNHANPVHVHYVLLSNIEVMLEKWTAYYSFTARNNLALEIKTSLIQDDFKTLVEATFENSALNIEFLPDHEIRKERYLNHLSYTSIFNFLQVI